MIIGVVLATVFKVMNVTLLLLLILFLAIIIPVALLIQVPFVTFFRYYSLQVLGGRLNAKYALLPGESMDEPPRRVIRGRSVR